MASKLTGIDLIAAERQRQMSDEGWSDEHDDQHNGGQLARAAACYAQIPELRDYFSNRFVDRSPYGWPFSETYWKPNPDNRIRELTKAGALIAAEIDRLLRKQELDRADLLFEVANGQRDEPVDLSEAERQQLALLRGTLRAIDNAWTQEPTCGPSEE